MQLITIKKTQPLQMEGLFVCFRKIVGLILGHRWHWWGCLFWDIRDQRLGGEDHGAGAARGWAGVPESERVGDHGGFLNVRHRAAGLLEVQGPDLMALMRAADLTRKQDKGDDVSFVVNRNINFTNICQVGCSFCGFSRQKGAEDAYDHSLEVLVDKFNIMSISTPAEDLKAILA